MNTGLGEWKIIILSKHGLKTKLMFQGLFVGINITVPVQGTIIDTI